MRWEIVDDRGNLLGSFAEEDAALDALDQIVGDRPAAAERVALFAYDDQDRLAAPTRYGLDLFLALSRVSVNENPWTYQPARPSAGASVRPVPRTPGASARGRRMIAYSTQPGIV